MVWTANQTHKINNPSICSSCRLMFKWLSLALDQLSQQQYSQHLNATTLLSVYYSGDLQPNSLGAECMILSP